MKKSKPGKAPERPGYETRDVAPRRAVYAGIALLLGIVVSVALVMGILALLPARERPAKPAVETAAQEPPVPRLEIDGRADRAALEDAAAAKLTGYAWVDRSTGTTRIPIARAMELLATHGWSGVGGASAP